MTVQLLHSATLDSATVNSATINNKTSNNKTLKQCDVNSEMQNSATLKNEA